MAALPRRVLAAALILAACGSAAFLIRARSHASSNLRALPSLVLWAWERREDLRFIDPANTAVAFLAETIQLRDGEARVRPRFQPLQVPDRAKLIAVVRIESAQADLHRVSVDQKALSQAQLVHSVDSIARLASLPRVAAVQIDFDATLSERSFYRDLLVLLRQRLAPNVPISITALASWCIDDDWLSGLPIDEAVPMLFRMGVDANEVTARLASRRDFREPLCRTSMGVSTDERWIAVQGGRRLYVFNPQPWMQSTELALPRGASAWR
jgi:hypothetical protein